jgi:hypothetical protein
MEEQVKEKPKGRRVGGGSMNSSIATPDTATAAKR